MASQRQLGSAPSSHVSPAVPLQDYRTQLPASPSTRAALENVAPANQRPSDPPRTVAKPATSNSGREEFLYRLFVGWVPKTYSEQDLSPLFSQFGVVRDVLILKDKNTGQSRGCAFVSYATKQEAELAIQNLDRQVELPGALSVLEVRFAKSHQYVQASAGPNDNRQLFFSGAPNQLSESEISTFFSQFGVVEELNLFRERKTGVSKGCGFVSMQSREQALSAMEALENDGTEPGKDISVQWADPDLQFKKKKALEQSNADNRMLFFAKVLRSANEDDVRRVFSAYGRVYDVNLFRAFQGAPTTKGCGLVTMGTHEEARQAIEGLDNKYCWDGMDSPMVVKWMDAALQRRRREQHLAAMRQGLIPGVAAAAGHEAWIPQQMALAGMVGRPGMGGPALLLQEPEVSEPPPAGCAPDAIKLFVGNIPKACTQEQLLPFFETIGKVAELVIMRDKATQQSKGSAFVWYTHRAHAERAILQFNLRHVLPDPAGEQDRPLVVRKARTRTSTKGPALTKPMGPTPGLGGLAGPSGTSMVGHPGVTVLSGGMGGSHILGLGPQQAFYTASAPAGGRTLAATAKLSSGLAFGGHMGGGLDGLQPQTLTMQPSGAGPSTSAGYGLPLATSANTYRTQGLTPSGGLTSNAQLVSIQTTPNVADAGLFDAYAGDAGAGGSAGVERYLVTAPMQAPGGGGAGGMPGANGGMGGLGGPGDAGGAGVGGMAQLALSLPLNVQQLGLVNTHLYSVQSMSGAQVNISPGAPGLFHLLISGSKVQVESARNLVSSVLGHAIM